MASPSSPRDPLTRGLAGVLPPSPCNEARLRVISTASCPAARPMTWSTLTAENPADAFEDDVQLRHTGSPGHRLFTSATTRTRSTDATPPDADPADPLRAAALQLPRRRVGVVKAERPRPRWL